VVLLKAQAASPTYPDIQAGQMMRRTFFGGLTAIVMLALPFTLLPLRFLMGNRLMKWLATISMNYYLVHQNLAVHLKRLGIPASVTPEPHRAGERLWQWQYTALCFGLSVLLAVAITYLIEKPGARLLGKLFAKINRRENAET